MKKKITISVVVLIIGLIAVLTFIRVVEKKKMTMKRPNESVATVGVVKMEKTNLVETISGHAIVKGNPQIKVYTSGDVSGLFIKNNYNEGDHVKKNAVIAFIDRNTPGNNYSEVPVVSPIDGVITKLYFFDRGSKVASTAPIAEITNIDSVKLSVNLGSADIVKVKEGQTALITSDYTPDLKISSKVGSVTPFIDSDSFSGEVTIYVNNTDRRLQIGLSVNVEIAVDTRMTFVVPDSAVLVNDDLSYVFINENNIAKQITVKTGYSSKGVTEIFGDFTEGMSVVNEGNFKINDGDKIKVVAE